jgi:hypothetical protein
MYRAFAVSVSTLSLTLAALLSPAFTLALTPPTLVDYNESSFTDTGLNDETTGSISWQTGDIVIVLGATADNAITLGTPTATGLTFALVDSTAEDQQPERTSGPQLRAAAGPVQSRQTGRAVAQVTQKVLASLCIAVLMVLEIQTRLQV